MSGHYEEREIKIIVETYVCDNEFDCAKSISYELRVYNEDGTYEVVAYSDDLIDLLERGTSVMRTRTK